MASKYAPQIVRNKCIDYLNYLVDYQIDNKINNPAMAATITELYKLVNEHY